MQFLLIIRHDRWFMTRDKEGNMSPEAFPSMVALPDGEFSIRTEQIGFSFKP
jgi:hypothetical protein